MTKPAIPSPVRHDVVEIDAMDVAEWESGQSTPQASDANLAELVRKTATQPELPTRVLTVARERFPTQVGAPIIPRPPSRARTAPPGPAPEPTRPRTSGDGARATRVPDIPAGPGGARRSTQTPVGGVDFSLPITATSPGMPAAPERSPAQTPVGGIDFSRPATSATPRPSEPPRPRAATGSAPDLSRTATATSASSARLPEPEPPPPTRAMSPFAEPSRVGPGHNASPAGGAEPNTAWPPRPIPVDPSSQRRPQPSRLAASEPSIRRSRPPGRDDRGADRLNVALSHRRLWWIGGGLAAACLAGIIVAVALPNPDALPPEASLAGGAQLVQATGPRRDPPSAQPVDRAAADLRDRVRIARDAAAAAARAAAERRSTPGAAADPAMRGPSDETAASRPAGKKVVHKVVVDYTSRPNEPAPPRLAAQAAGDPAIGQARGAYTTGNQRLFAGDLAGAIHAYRETLEIYPGYVAGYRGLGLAYEQLGDTANALAALRAYVAAVPNARDVALIKKRIVHLQRR